MKYLIIIFFFLSQMPVGHARPHVYAELNALQMSDSVPFDTPKPPVPYAQFDTSKLLEGWFYLYEAQYQLGVYHEILDIQQQSLNRARSKIATADLEGMRTGLGMALIAIALLILSVLTVWCLGEVKPKRR